MKKKYEGSLIAKIQKKYVLLSIQILLVYSLALKSGLFIFSDIIISLMFTNARIKNQNTRIENYSEPQYSLAPKSRIPYSFT
jgi:hypothetical protein